MSHERGKPADGVPRPVEYCTAAAPSRLLRGPFQPTDESGSSALSLNGNSSVSDTHLKWWPTYFDASFNISSLYFPDG
jgi:hypothetical protein